MGPFEQPPRLVLTLRQPAEQPVFVNVPLGQMVLNHCAFAVFVLLRYAPVRLALVRVALVRSAKLKFAPARLAPEQFGLHAGAG